MRRGSDNGWLLDKDGKTVGINLGADFCAEHEWGIKDIRRAFKMVAEEDRSIYGIERRTMQGLPDPDWDKKARFAFEVNKGRPPRGVLIFCGHNAQAWLDGIMGREKMYHNELWLPDPDARYNQGRECNLATAWSEGDFGIHVRGKDYCNRLKEIWDAFQRNDIAIWVGGGGVFQNGGLIIAIRSRCPQEGVQKMAEADAERWALEKAGEATGIFELLKKAGKTYFYLGAQRWQENALDSNGNKIPIFWLNPMQQDKYESGWFTADELRLWAEDKGPVMKKVKGAA